MEKILSIFSDVKKLFVIVLGTGLILQAFFFIRGAIGHNDQVILLNVGLDFIKNNNFQPVAKGISGGGHLPGCLLQLLIGVPLKIFPHFKAPNTIIGIFHIIAVFLLINVINKTHGMKFTVIFLGLYWLSPWRLYHSGILWEPSYLYFPAALHLWICYRLKDNAAFLSSIVLGLVLICTFQIHASSLIILVLTAVLWYKGFIKLHWAGFFCGLLVGGITLLPTISAFYSGTLPNIAPKEGFIGRGLIFVFPAAKSVLYWIRFGSLDAGGIIKGTIFFKDQYVNAGPGYQMLSVAVKGLYAVAIVSVVFCAVAAFKFFHNYWKEKSILKSNGRTWIAGYTFCAFVAMFISACLSPVTTQSWHVIIIFHSACISIAYWIEEKWQGKSTCYRWVIIAFFALRIPLAIVIGSGNGWYRLAPLETNISQELITDELLDILPESIAGK